MEDKFRDWLNSDGSADKPGFDEIQRRLLYKFNSRWYLSNDDAADCVQETLARVLQNLERGKISPAVKPIAHILAVANNVLKEKRKDKIGQTTERVDWEHCNLAGVNPEDYILADIELERYRGYLEKCLQALTTDKRELISMFYENDCHFNEEILARFPEPAKTLSVRLHRIRESLRSCVEKYLMQ